METKPRDVGRALASLGCDLVEVAEALGAVVYTNNDAPLRSVETVCANGLTIIYIGPGAAQADLAFAVVELAARRWDVVTNTPVAATALLLALARANRSALEEPDAIQRSSGF